MIYFYCPENEDRPSGGVRVAYRHVDILNAAGVRASIVHRVAGFRCSWFSNSTAIDYWEQIQFRPEDLLVLPEIVGPKAAEIAPGIRKVIFNQNAYYTFGGCELGPAMTTAYGTPEIVGVVCVSEDNREYLEYAFPGMRVKRVHYSIDPKLFYFSQEKRRRIAFMPRKHADHAIQVFGMLIGRGALEGFEVFPIDGLSEMQTAEALRQSLIFLSFGYPEGCPFPPSEAMACGCVVIGYDGNGGKEYFRPGHSFPVAFGDIRSFAQTVEKLVGMLATNPGEIERMRKRASEYILASYPVEQERQEVVEIWTGFLKAGIPA